ncbi:MAG: YqhA family protein [Methanolinea sp.]|nr:YqhA family protein [Methanolinea sp.]
MDTQVPAGPHGPKGEQGIIESFFESGLWTSRLVVILAVAFGTFSAIVLFVSGSLEILNTLNHAIDLSTLEVEHTNILIGIIGAVDFYLIGMVLLIFSFGIYELFISEIDVARRGQVFHNILEISNLDDLKNKIIKVIIMVLIVSFFQRVLALQMLNGTDMLFMALSIAALCIGVFFLQKLKF